MRGARLGQHFLNAPWVARDLVASLAVRDNETILEIGPGKGALTKVLLETGHPVIAIEKDEMLVEYLNHEFASAVASKQLTILGNDIRDFTPEDVGLATGKYVLAANIPYYITGEIIRMFLETKMQPRAMALLIQKEVAERIVARDGKESILSLSVKAYGKPRIVAKVPAGCFNPPPSVDSAILLVENISRDFFADLSENDFFKVIKAGFAAKRKQLGGNIEKIFGGRGITALEQARIARTARAEDLTLEEWRGVATFLKQD